jgi:hypothetical protein
MKAEKKAGKERKKQERNASKAVRKPRLGQRILRVLAGACHATIPAVIERPTSPLCQDMTAFFTLPSSPPHKLARYDSFSSVERAIIRATRCGLRSTTTELSRWRRRDSVCLGVMGLFRNTMCHLNQEISTSIMLYLSYRLRTGAKALNLSVLVTSSNVAPPFARLHTSNTSFFNSILTLYIKLYILSEF